DVPSAAAARGEGDGGGGDALQGRPEGGIAEPAEVVVEPPGGGSRPLLRSVEARLTPEQVLPPLHGPHRPALGLLDDRLRERREVGRARRSAGIQDQDVPRVLLADLQNTDLVQVSRSARSREAVEPHEPHRRSGPRVRHDYREGDCERQGDQPETSLPARMTYRLHGVLLRSTVTAHYGDPRRRVQYLVSWVVGLPGYESPGQWAPSSRVELHGL